MKKLLIIPFFAISIFSFAQIKPADIDVANITTEISHVFFNDSPKEKKHLKAKEWVTKTFGDYKSVLQFEDNENCKLIIKGKSALPTEDLGFLLPDALNMTSMPVMHYTITIDCKDDRYRIKLEDIVVKNTFSTYLLGEKIDTQNPEQNIQQFCCNLNPSDFDNKVLKLEEELKNLSLFNNPKMNKKQKKDLEEKKEGLKKEIEESKLTNKALLLNIENRKTNVQSIIFSLINSLWLTIDTSDEF